MVGAGGSKERAEDRVTLPRQSPRASLLADHLLKTLGLFEEAKASRRRGHPRGESATRHSLPVKLTSSRV